MFCKVCKDAGKSEQIFKSHYVRNAAGPNGKVVCPTLLNQICRKCNKKGHTNSYCPVSKKENWPNCQTTTTTTTTQELKKQKGNNEKQSPPQSPPQPPPPPPYVPHKSQLVNWAGIVAGDDDNSAVVANSTAIAPAPKYEREDSPTPSPVSSRPPSPPPAPKKMPQVKEEEEEEEDTKCYPSYPSLLLRSLSPDDCLKTPSSPISSRPTSPSFIPTPMPIVLEEATESKYIPEPKTSWFDTPL
jgi:hypothetical protein